MSKDLNILTNLAQTTFKSAMLTEGTDTMADPNRICLVLKVVLI